MKTKHTKGEWTYSPMRGQIMHCICAQVWDSEGKNLAVIDSVYGEEEATANAKLIAEAGTVANETGKTPRQLADENKELLEALNYVKAVIEKNDQWWIDCPDKGGFDLDIIKNAINKATK